MFGLAVLAAVLAIAGAPATTPVSCDPNIAAEVAAPPGYVVYGVTYGTAYVGSDHFETITRVVLGTTACGAILYAGASPTERAAIRALNPSVNFDQLEGYGLLVALHEGTHVGTKSRNECLVEKTALANVHVLLERYADNVAAAEAAAAAFDASTPANYRGC